MAYSELKTVFEENYGPLNHDDASETLFCPAAGVVIIDGKLIAYDKITNVRVCHSKNYISNVYGDHECNERITASIDGYYNESENSSTVYDYDDIEESSSISVNYDRNGIGQWVIAVVHGDRQYWLEDLIEYIVEKAGIDKKVALESQLRPGGNSITRKREERKEFRARQRWLEKNGFIKDNRSFFQKVRDVVLIPFLYIFFGTRLFAFDCFECFYVVSQYF